MLCGPVSHNNECSFCLSSTGAFANLVHLYELKLHNNELVTIPEDMFNISNLPSLTVFRIYSNPTICNQSACWIVRALGVWITELTSQTISYADCHGPPALDTRPIDTLTVAELQCTGILLCFVLAG